jgi:hypothetical protein
VGEENLLFGESYFSSPQLLFSEIWIMLKSFSEQGRILEQSQSGENAVWEKLKK